MSSSKVVDKLPVTLALLVKPIKVSSTQMELQFSVMQYGFSPNTNTLLTQPRIIFENGKTAEIKIAEGDSQLSIKVFGKWV